MNRPSVIALDGDNTLWRDRNEFVVTRERFHELLAPYLPANGRAVDEKLDGIARKFLALHGYTLSGFSQALSDTAAEVAGGAVPADVRKALESLSREMQEHPLALVDGTRSVLTQLTERGHILWLVTRGELLEQASKVARSGLTSLFARVEVVQHKGAAPTAGCWSVTALIRPGS
jgi:putative hydrolase of the HAD superfamily